MVAIGGSLLVLLPLFELPGLELGLAVSALCALLGGWTGAGAADELRKFPRPSVPRILPSGPGTAAARAIGAATLALWVAATIPFVAAVLRSGLTTRCNPFAQAGFFPMLVLPAALLAAAAASSAAPRFRPGAGPSRCTPCCCWRRWPGRSGRWCSGHSSSPSTSSSGCSRARSTTRRCGCPIAGLVPAGDGALGGGAGTCTAAIFPAPGPAHPQHRTRVLTTLVVLALAIAALEMGAVRLGFRSSDAAVRTLLGGRTETEHAEILYPREKSPEEVERLRRDVEFRLAQLARFFGAPPASVRVVVFRSPEEKQRWGGAGGTQFAKPWLGSVFLNDAPFPTPR
jgi:hypothetical protein